MKYVIENFTKTILRTFYTTEIFHLKHTENLCVHYTEYSLSIIHDNINKIAKFFIIVSF